VVDILTDVLLEPANYSRGTHDCIKNKDFVSLRQKVFRVFKVPLAYPVHLVHSTNSRSTVTGIRIEYRLVHAEVSHQIVIYRLRVLSSSDLTFVLGNRIDVS